MYYRSGMIVYFPIRALEPHFFMKILLSGYTEHFGPILYCFCMYSCQEFEKNKVLTQSHVIGQTSIASKVKFRKSDFSNLFCLTKNNRRTKGNILGPYSLVFWYILALSSWKVINEWSDLLSLLLSTIQDSFCFNQSNKTLNFIQNVKNSG